ncbi:tetratricopeptide repeat protein [Vibrio paucivorans]
MALTLNQISEYTVPWKVPTLTRKWKRHVIWLVILVNILAAGLSTRSYLLLWLSNDQLGRVYFQLGEYTQASEVFEDNKWRARSLYMAEDFKTSAQTWAQVTDLSANVAMFNQANAYAHQQNYYQAFVLYQKILDTTPNHQGAKKNIEIVEPLIKTSASLGDSGDNAIIDKESQQESIENLGNQYQAETLSDQEWLESIESDPKVFLKKKFFIEQYEEAKRKAQQAQNK